METGVRGFVDRSATSLRSERGICGGSLSQAVSNMSLAAEGAGERLWVRRKGENILPGAQAKVSQLANELACLFDQG